MAAAAGASLSHQKARNNENFAAERASNIPQDKMAELITLLNEMRFGDITIQVTPSRSNLISKQTIQVYFNIPGIESWKKPYYDIHVKTDAIVKKGGEVLPRIDEYLDEIRNKIIKFKESLQHGGRRIKYNKKRVTHKKRTRHIRRKYSRRN